MELKSHQKSNQSARHRVSTAKADLPLEERTLDSSVPYSEHAHLYLDLPKFDLHEYLKDESEDEEEQVDHEINGHRS